MHTHTHIYRQYQKLSKFWQGKNIKTSVFRTCILITQNTEQVLRISELLSVIQNSYIYGNHGNLKMELTLLTKPVSKNNLLKLIQFFGSENHLFYCNLIHFKTFM